ncbi:MAG: metallophosphoesterase family protein [Candidatus Thermoplasmatota archaeon]
MKIAHISDIHFGMSWMFIEKMAKKGIERLNRENPDVVIITGDLTDYGLKKEYKGVKRLLDNINCEYLAIPGNHDARHQGASVFEEYIGERFFVKKIGKYKFVGLDSSQPDLDEGHIGREQIEKMKRYIGRNSIIILHHHLLPVPDTGRERNVLVDAGDVLKLLSEYKVKVVLNGHKHVPWVWEINNIVISTAGTISCERTPYTQSLNIVEIDKKIKIRKINVSDGKEKVIVFEGK